MAEPVNDWLEELARALAAERRLRRGRIVDEASDHLRSSAESFEEQGRSRAEAQAKAVAQLGDPESFARGFSRPNRRDWLVDATAWSLPRAAAILLGLGALMVLVETLAWSIGAEPVSAQGVRVWRTCRHSVGGECLGGWDDTTAPSLLVLGAICLALGLAALSAYSLLRRRYSDLELMPRTLGLLMEVSLGALGLVFLVGGASRSSLDASWHWVPLWVTVGLACLGAALFLHRSDPDRQRRGPALRVGSLDS